jgi:alginate O-acetyltransferase complex protein AlgI
MIFTSFEFVIFFAVVLLVRAGLRDFSAEKWFLLAASYVFYMSWSIPCGFLILFTSLLDYYVGSALGRIEIPLRRKWLLTLSLAANLGVLGFFKYNNFFLDNAWNLLSALGFQASHWHANIILPVGISFFTFQSMSYTIDVYRGNIKPCRSPRDFLLYVAFFPQLVAGPIVRASDFLPQLVRRLRPSVLEVEAGLAQFALGAVKKLVISDQISGHVDMIFASPGSYDGFTLLEGVLGYAVQIYCDFSGYSDMAVGSARMMGFRFMENFQMPYSSVTITEFWRRWHISLSSWLRDYLYIPLGGNRKGVRRTYVNLMLTMILGGLWHGASWNFVLWGTLHGGALAVHKGWSAWDPLPERLKLNPAFQVMWSVLSRALTLGIVLVGWVFFRAQSWGAATEYLARLFRMAKDGTHLVSPYILAAFAAVVLVHLVVNKDRQWAHEIPGRAMPVRIVAYACLAILLACLSATDSAPFIYFQF